MNHRVMCLGSVRECIKARSRQVRGGFMRPRREASVEQSGDATTTHADHYVISGYFSRRPYFLRKLKIERANPVWAMDITYIPMARGFVYLAVVVGWATRRVLSHRVSITMEADFCVEALEEALAKHGEPEIFNPDQGCQFTSDDFTGALTKNAIGIGMDGKGSLARQRVRRTAMARREIRGGLSESLRQRRRTRALRLAAIWSFTMAGARIRRLTGARRTGPTSPRGRSRRRHDPAGIHLTSARTCSDNRGQL